MLLLTYARHVVKWESYLSRLIVCILTAMKESNALETTRGRNLKLARTRTGTIGNRV